MSMPDYEKFELNSKFVLSKIETISDNIEFNFIIFNNFNV